MKGLFALAVLCISASCLHAQVVDTTVCEILKNPQSFNGKIVRVTGTAAANFDQFVVKGPECGEKIDGIWLAYPEGTKAKSGPAAILQLQPAHNFSGTVTASIRTTVSLEKNKDFKQFDSLLSTPYKASVMCLGCIKYEVKATLVGRLDGTTPELKRDSTGKIVSLGGFGNLNAYSARLVLQSVSDVAAQEIDYSKATASRPTQQLAEAGLEIANTFASTVPLQEHPKRAIAAFGKEGDDNGVSVGSMSNEASDRDESKSGHDSPDGVQYNCQIDFERLKDDSLGRAMAHLGEHIADLRKPEQGLDSAGLYQLEYRAWMTTMLSAIMSGQKSLMIPGGYELWNSSWPQANLNTNTNEALKAFLANQALLRK
jgi:hypothetical protein